MTIVSELTPLPLQGAVQLNSGGNVAVIQEKVRENVLDIRKSDMVFILTFIMFLFWKQFKAKPCRNLEACETMFKIFNN